MYKENKVPTKSILDDLTMYKELGNTNRRLDILNGLEELRKRKRVNINEINRMAVGDLHDSKIVSWRYNNIDTLNRAINRLWLRYNKIR